MEFRPGRPEKERLTKEEKPGNVDEKTREEEYAKWGPKAIVSAGGRFGEGEDVLVSYIGGKFLVDNKEVSRREFIDVIGPHLERLKKIDPVFNKLIGE